MNPLQVTGASVDDMAVVVCEDGKFTFSAAFNKPLNPDGVKSDNVTLHGALSGSHDDQVGYDSEKRMLSVAFQDLPADFYTLRLLGGKGKISDAEGLLFDGTGNGILELWRDHYAIHFRLDRGDMKPVLPLPENHP